MRDLRDDSPAGDESAARRLGHAVTELSPLPLAAAEGRTHAVTYLNPALARLVGRERADLIGRPVADVLPGVVVALLDLVLRTGVPGGLAEVELAGTGPAPVYWSCAAWAAPGGDARPAGVLVQLTDATAAAVHRRQAVAVNEALVLSAVRQHELAEAADALNARLREAHDRLETRVAERTAELAAANAALVAEMARRGAAEAGRRSLLARLDTAQEDERRRLSRDLHDQIGQLLAGIGMGLKAVEEATPDSSPARPHLSYLRTLTDRVSREGHQLALDLRPTALDDMGLPAALEGYAGEWSRRSGVPIDLQVVGLEGSRVPTGVETGLYRVIQEALTNAHRHAAARHVSLVLQRSQGHVVAVVEDDGVGFAAPPEGAEVPAGGRLGLLGMRERMAVLGGTLTVESALGRGTTVIARVPLTRAPGP